MLLFLLNVVTSPSAVANTEVNVPTITSDFNEGWKDGYCEGWRDVKGQYTICPIAPISPIPPIGHDSYKGGYNLGFKAGSKAANN